MRAGRQRHRVQVQQAIETNDGQGNVTRVWVSKGYAWAAIEPISGMESWRGHKVEGRLTHGVIMRVDARFTLNQTHRLCFDREPRILNVVSVRDIHERGREWQVLCTEDTTETVPA